MSNRPTKKTSASTRVREASQANERSRTLWIVIGVFVVIAVAAIVAIAVNSSSSDSEGGTASPSGGTVVPKGDLPYGAIEVKGTSLPQAPVDQTTGQPTGTDPALGMTIPTVVGQSFDTTLTISPEGGQGQIVMFVAHWCPHCQKEVPLIQGWLDQNGMPSDVKLTAVATATDPDKPNYPPAAWLRKEKWSVPTMLDDKQQHAAQAFGLSGYPYFVVVGPDGKVVERTSGEQTVQAWEAMLEAARTGVAPGQPTGGAASPAGQS